MKYSVYCENTFHKTGRRFFVQEGRMHLSVAQTKKLLCHRCRCEGFIQIFINMVKVEWILDTTTRYTKAGVPKQAEFVSWAYDEAACSAARERIEQRRKA